MGDAVHGQNFCRNPLCKASRDNEFRSGMLTVKLPDLVRLLLSADSVTVHVLTMQISAFSSPCLFIAEGSELVA